MNKASEEDVIRALNGLNHEILAHKVFQRCFGQAIKSGEIQGLEKTSLFRSTLAYFLLVPNARESFLHELARVKA